MCLSFSYNSFGIILFSNNESSTLFLVLVYNGFLLQAAEVQNLRCEYLSNPLGVDVSSPRLSWMIVSSTRGDLQKAYPGCSFLLP